MKSMTQAPQPEAIRRFAAEAGLTQVGDTCDADTLAARAEFWRMLDDRRRAAQGDVQPFEATLREANLVQQIGCTPTNGMAWAELGELESETRGWNDKVIRYLALSQQYAPFEGLPLTLRLDLLSRSGLPLSDGGRELLRRDLAASLQFASPQEAASQLSRLPDSEGAWADAFLETLPADRVSAIRAAAKALPPAEAN